MIAILKLGKLILLAFLLFACTSSDADHGINFTTITVEDSELIITHENAADLKFPSFIRTASKYFLLYDDEKIFKFNYDGGLLASFGRGGRGPGEIQSLTNYWIMEDHYLLYDYNGAKMIRYDLNGSFMDENSVDIGELTASIELLSTGEFVHPANGEEGSLLKVSDPKNGETRYIGKAIAVLEEEPDEDYRSMIRSGRLPNYMLNSVSLGVNESGIFSFQMANAVLQKFHFNGELLWEINLKIPPVDGVYEEFLKELKEQDRYIPQLSYGHGVHAIDKGVYFLLNTPDDKPTTIIWISNNGDEIKVIEYPNIKRHSFFPLRFRVTPDSNHILFVKSFDGEILRSSWPIN